MVLWELLFSLFGVSWVEPFSVWDILLGWNRYFIAHDQKRVLKARPLCIFCAVWKERNDIVSRDEVLSIQKVSFLVYLFWLETKMPILDGSMTLIQSIGWMDFR